MDEITRVFFHELGHFISHEISFQFFNGHKTKSIRLWPHPDYSELYLGVATIEHEEEKYQPKREELARYLATSTYGCFFQAYFQQRGLRAVQDANGGDDLEKWFNSLRLHKLDLCNADIHAIDLEVSEELKKDKILEPMMQLDPQKYLVDKGNGVFEVNLEPLREDSKGFIEEHRPFFEKLVNRYEAVLTQEEKLALE